MAHFVKSVFINAPVETVFGFHEREDALSLLSPPFPPVRVIRKHGGIEPGSWVELKIGPIRWTALHSGFKKNRFFEDTQIGGPFAVWIHRHEFDSWGDATKLTDRIEFRLKGGQLVNCLIGWAVQVVLNAMFRQRHQRTKEFCEKGRK